MILSLLFIGLILMREVSSHGRLIDPPSRSSMWRFGFNTEKNFNDHELFCGGFTTQWEINGGKCGICGDPWNMPRPRDNEAGGKYGKGIIVREYQPSQVIVASVQITANHKGYFEFKICPINDSKINPDQECFDKYPLYPIGSKDYKYFLTSFTPQTFNVNLQLPKDLSCRQCVFQWTYTAGNNWGICPDGKGKLGCGRQETFRACADVKIGNGERYDILSSEEKSVTPVISVPTSRPTPSTTISVQTSSTQSGTTSKKLDQGPNPDVNDTNDQKGYKCQGVGIWQTLPGIQNWCVENCSRGFCPPSHCTCT